MSRPVQHFRVCIDSRMLGDGGTGVSTYARALRDALPLVTDRRLVLRAAPPAIAGRAARWLAAASPGVRRARIVADPDDRGETILAGRDLFRVAQVHFDLYGKLMRVRAPGPPGIMHWTYPVPLRMVGWRNVYTIHDAVPLVAPELTPIDPRRHARLLARIAAAAAAIATVSDAARAEIAAALPDKAARIVNCGTAVTPGAVATGPLPEGLAPGGYLLLCGSVEPRKNVARVLAGYRASGVALPLVVAGPDGMGADALRATIAATPGVVRLPYLPEAAMQALVAGARALLMPSLAEGFGLPVVEAMARGTPVLTSDRGALAETAGGAALLVDPLDVPALAAGISRLVADDALCATLSAAGRANAARFTRADFAERLAALYQSVDPRSEASHG